LSGDRLRQLVGVELHRHAAHVAGGTEPFDKELRNVGTVRHHLLRDAGGFDVFGHVRQHLVVLAAVDRPDDFPEHAAELLVDRMVGLFGREGRRQQAHRCGQP
jgi:hypothetical protein